MEGGVELTKRVWQRNRPSEGAPKSRNSQYQHQPALFSTNSLAPKMLLPLLLLLLAAAAVAVADAAGGCSTASSPAAPPPPPSIYELLPKYGLPPGLLPDSVTGFSLAPDGAFSVTLAKPCYINFEYLVYYAPSITGVVKYGGIEQLKGIQVRRFLVWFDVNAIKVDLPPSDWIYFQVGWINKQLSVDQFQDVHSCNKDGVFETVRARVATTKDFCRLPEPIREVDMLLFE